MLEVYVVAGGDWYRHVLNAVAAFMQTDTGTQVKRFWPADFFVLFYVVHLAVLGILAG
ncbi:hypothetical protein TUM16664_49510 [Enterobacter cloacae]|nr:hypothetical protein TUM16664_49510 [Enterobacter cloacae]